MEKAMKKLVFILVILLLLLAIPASVFLVAQRQELRKRAAPATTLSIVPATLTKAPGDVFTMEVKIDTGVNQVIATEISLTFDPEKLEAQSITNGSLFPNILTSGLVDRGVTSISVGAASSAQPVTGTGTAAVVRFKALAGTGDTPATIRFGPNTFVGGLGESGKNILIGSNPSRVTISGSATATTGSTSTATASATLTPTPTPAGGSFGQQESTTSAVQITTPIKNASVSTDTPTLTGKAPPGSTVTVTIYSTPITVTVTADSNGNWTYTPTAPLEDGPHNVVVSTVVAGGQTVTASSSFVVASGTEGSSTSATPVAGSAETTLLLLSLGTLLLVSGLLVPSFAKNRNGL